MFSRDQITCNKRLFGDVNVTAIGDLYQLKPVQEAYRFETL